MQRFFNQKSSKTHVVSLSRAQNHRKVIEDVKYVLSNHYQDTEFDPYGPEGNAVTNAHSVQLVSTAQPNSYSSIASRSSTTQRVSMVGIWLNALEQWCHSLLKFLQHQDILQILAKMFQQIRSTGQIA